MFKKIVTIVLPIIAVTAAIFVFGLKVYQDSFDKFQYDGFVIGTSSGKESSKYHFSKDEKYKVNETKGEVTFTNNENEDVSVPEASFVHYTDGSISTFKKAVVLNMANVKTDSLQYYNVFNGSVFTKTGEGYQIKYLEQTLSFDNFLVKVSDSKYMIVGKNISIKYGEKEENVADGFLEINYLDGNIIRIENQDILLQNISTDIAIEVDGIKTDLLNKKIIYEDETKVNLGEITIDSDDNIEIIPDEENTEIIEQEAQNEIADIENQPVVAPGVDVSGMESGIIDTSVEQVETIVKDNQKIPDPRFIVESFEILPNLVTTKVSIDDEKGVLKGDVEVKIVDNATNEYHCREFYAYGQPIGTQGVYSCKSLSPGRNYSLIISSKYEKNEITYEKDFVQRTFVTPTPGISIEEDYVSDDQISFVVKFRDEMAFSKFTYTVIESAKGSENGIVETGVFDKKIPQKLKDENQKNIDISCATESKNNFAVVPPSGDDLSTDIKECYVTIGKEETGNEIKSNTKYSLIINNIYNEESVIIPNYQVYKTVTTLKQKPTYGSTDGTNNSTVIVNKMSSEFVIYLNNLSDVNNSVINYRADIYEKVTGKFVASYEALPSSQIKIPVGNAEQGATISRYGEGYNAKIYITYHDNEKEVQEYLGNQSLYMGSKEAPTATFSKGVDGIVEFDKIKGVVKIQDPQKAIVDGSYISLKITNQSDGKIISYPLQFVRANIEDNTMSIPIDENNLKQDTSYLFEVQAYINLGDQIITEDGTPVDVGEHIADIGSFVIKTPTASFLNSVWKNNTTQGGGQAFSVSFALTEGNDYYNTKHNKLTDTEINQLTAKELELYNKAQTEYDHYEYKRLQKIKIRFSKADQVIQSDDQCISENYCWQKEFQDEDPSMAVNTIFEQFYVERDESSRNPTIGYARVGIDGSYKATFCQDCNTGVDAKYNFGMDSTDLIPGTYKLEVLGTVDNSDYSNYISIRYDIYQFTPNANPDVKIINPELFKENYIYEKQDDLFNRDVTNLQSYVTGYSFVPSINRETIPSRGEGTESEKAKLQFNYYLYDLSQNVLIDLTGQNIDTFKGNGELLFFHDPEGTPDSAKTYGISFTTEKFNKINPDNKITAGKPIGFCYDLTVFYDNNNDGDYDEGIDEKAAAGDSTAGVPSYKCTASDRALKDDFQQKRQAPTMSTRLKTTEYVQSANATRLIFDYTIYDHNGALYDYIDASQNNLGRIAMYKTGNNEYQPIKCNSAKNYTQTKDCLEIDYDKRTYADGEFAVLITQNTTLTTEIYYRKLDGSHPDITDDSLKVAAKYETANPLNALEVATIVEPFANSSGINYSISQNTSENTTTFTLTGDYAPKTLKTYVVATEIKLTPISADGDYGTTMILYKDFDNENYLNSTTGNTIPPTITISNEEIGSIAGAYDYDIKMRFIYNKFYFGFDQDISPGDTGYVGFAVYAKRGAEYFFNDMGTGTKFFRDLKYLYGEVSMVPGTAPEKEYLKLVDGKYTSKNAVTVGVASSAKGIVYTDNNKRTNYINFARMFEQNIYCTNDTNKNGKIDNGEDNTSCSMNVSIENPIFQMEDEEVKEGLGNITYNFKLTIPDNIPTEDFVLVRSYYQVSSKQIGTDKETGLPEYENTCIITDQNGADAALKTIETPLNIEEGNEPSVGGIIQKKDYNSYQLTDTVGVGLTGKCVVFKWQGKVKDPADNEYHETTEPQKFSYGAAYHSSNPTKPNREYIVAPINSLQISDSAYNYDTGTIQYSEDNKDRWNQIGNNKKQHTDYRRTLSYSLKLDSFYDVDWFEFKIYKYAGVSSITNRPIIDSENYIPIEIENVYVGTNSYNDENRLLSGVFSLDGTKDEDGNVGNLLYAGEVYVFVVTPYRYCTVGQESKEVVSVTDSTYHCTAVEGRESEVQNGKQRIPSATEAFSYDISPASVIVTRMASETDDSGEKTPVVRIAVDDSNRTVGSYAQKEDVKFAAEYYITVETDNNNISEISSLENSRLKFESATGAESVKLAECKGKTKCIVRVQYVMDLDNNPENNQTSDGTLTTGEKSETYQKEINMSIESDLGIISATLGTSKVQLYFSSHYRPWEAKEYTYTLTPLSADEDKQMGTGLIEEWDESIGSDEVLELEFTLLTKLKYNRSYSLYVKFKDGEGKEISDWSGQGLIAK